MLSLLRQNGPRFTPWQLLTSKWARNRWRSEKEWRRKLPEADIVVVSHAKSGRTWLKALLSRLYQRRFGLAENLLLSHDNMHNLNPQVPTVFFTHDGDPIGSIKSLRRDKSAYDGKKVIYLMRHPCDVAVSHYFQLKYRKVRKKKYRKAPRELGIVKTMDLYDFVMRPDHGLAAIIEYTNLWHSYVCAREDALLVRYEDLHSRPESTLRRVSDFLGMDFTDEEISEAIAFCSFEKLQERERAGFYGDSALRPVDKEDPNSFKVRRGKVGGYRDDFTDAQLEEIDSLMLRKLNPEIGYLTVGRSGEQSRIAAGGRL